MKFFFNITVLLVSVVILVDSTHHAKRTEDRNSIKQTGRTYNDMDVSDFSVYYSLKTNQTIKQMLPRPWYHPGWPLRLPFVGDPCNCSGLKCMCCAGIKISQFNFNRKACTELTYDPAEFMINIEVTMNGQRVMANSVSAKNPPPLCIPVPVPYLPPGLVDVCVRLFDISVQEQRLHVCMDMETRVDKAPVLVLHFDCMNMGVGGVSLTKPGGSMTQSVAASTSKPTNSSAAAAEQQDSDVYDVVTETKSDATEYPFKIAIKYI